MIKLNRESPPAPELEREGPLFDLAERHRLAERLLDLTLAECVRRLEQGGEESKKALPLGDVVKLLSLYQRQIAPRAEAEIARREAHAEVLRDLPSFTGSDEAFGDTDAAHVRREPIRFDPE